MERNLSLLKPDFNSQSLAAALFSGIVDSSDTSANIVLQVI